MSRWRRRSGTSSAFASRSSARASRGRRTARNAVPSRTKRAMIVQKIARRQRGEDLPHLLGREREQGEDREQRNGAGDQLERAARAGSRGGRGPSAGSPPGRGRGPRRSAPGRPGWRRRSRARFATGRRRSAATPPGRARTGPARPSRPSGGPTASAGRARRWRARPRAAGSRARRAPPRCCRRATIRGSSAFSICATKTIASTGTARLKTFVEARKSSMKSGRPARRKRRS